MTTSIKTSLIRKLTLGAGAILISTMTLAGAADAKTNFHINLDFGGHGGWGGGYYAPVYDYGPGYGFGYYGPNCHKYWKKYKITGKWYWKNKFYKCQAMYW